MSTTATVLFRLLAVLALLGCKKQHYDVSAPGELPYPRCADSSPAVTLATGTLRSGPDSPDPLIVERFSLVQDTCHFIAKTRQEWPMGTADVEVIYDRAWRPLRAWQRRTIPGSADGRPESRRYELRTEPVGLRIQEYLRPVRYEELRAAKPTVIISPGRGLVTAWLRKARLEVGQKVREVGLDTRRVEKISDTVLRRDPDRFLAALGRTVRSYTFAGRETIFADDTDTVIGDLSGLLPSSAVKLPMPPAIPLYGTGDDPGNREIGN